MKKWEEKYEENPTFQVRIDLQTKPFLYDKGQPITLYPGEVPAKLPNPDFWQKSRFDFTAFRPAAMTHDEPCQHIRIDKALDILIGDKLK